MRLVMNCPALRQDFGPFDDLSVLTKFALVQQVVRTCFCNCLTTRTNHKTTAARFFVFLKCWTSSRSQKKHSHLFSVTSDTLMMKSTNCYKICPLVRFGPYLQLCFSFTSQVTIHQKSFSVALIGKSRSWGTFLLGTYLKYIPSSYQGEKKKYMQRNIRVVLAVNFSVYGMF